MAYIDSGFPAMGGSAMTRGLVGTLDRLEWEVVHLARGDRVDSLREPGRWARLLAWAFGREAKRGLADPRLEALRRLAVMAWHYGYALPVSAIKDFKAAGFSMDQLETVLARISSARADSGRGATA